jgi:hypothetical protein
MHMTERIYGLWLPLWYLQALLKDMFDCAQKYLLLLDQTNLLHVRSSIISWKFARDISTVFEEIKHLSSRAPEHILPDY